MTHAGVPKLSCTLSFGSGLMRIPTDAFSDCNGFKAELMRNESVLTFAGFVRRVMVGKRATALIVSLMGLELSCRTPTEPCSTTEHVITTDEDKAALVFLDGVGACVEHRIVLGGIIESIAVSDDGFRAYVVTSANVARDLIVVDIKAATVVSRRSLATLATGAPTPIGTTGDVIALSDDQNAIYLWHATKADTVGIARFGLGATPSTAFSGPWNLVANGIVPISPSVAFPSGAIAAIGTRSALGSRNGQSRVYFLDPSSLSVIDSIVSSAINDEQDVWQFIPAPDGSSAYIAGRSVILRYNLLERRTTTSVARAVDGVLALSADGARLVLTDVGVWPDSPGSGLLRIYDHNLALLGTVDVSTPLGGSPNSVTATRTGVAVPGAGGTLVYVRGGSEARGSLYPVQPARVLLIDILSQRLVRTIPLRGYGLGPVFVARM